MRHCVRGRHQALDYTGRLAALTLDRRQQHSNEVSLDDLLSLRCDVEPIAQLHMLNCGSSCAYACAMLVRTCSYCEASWTGLLNFQTLEWDKQIVELLTDK